MEDYQQYCYPGTQCQTYMLRTEENVSLRVIHFCPGTPSPYPPLVMVVGLATVIESFKAIIVELTRDFDVYYVETREKSSSQLSGKVRFDMETVALDIVSVIKMLNLSTKPYVLFGYSYSVPVIIEAYHYLEVKPQCLLLLSPTPSFHYPSWSLFLIQFAVPLYGVLKPTAKWYIRNFVINRKEDHEMYLISSRVLDRADPWKLKSAILAVAGYKVWNKLDAIDCSTLIVDTSMDGMHRHEDIVRLARAIKQSTYIDLENNKRTHGAELVHVIRNYLSIAKNRSDQVVS